MVVVMVTKISWRHVLPAVLAFSLLMAPRAAAQSESASEPPASAKAPKAPASHSVAGTWALNAPRGAGFGWYNYALIPDEPPMTTWAQEKFKESKPSFGPHPVEESNDPAYSCFPNSVPRAYAGVQTAMQIIELPGRTLMLFGRNIRQIYTDGRPHPAEHHLQWMGHSIGKWDGDTFVVDTVDITDVDWLDRMGHPHSDKLHLIERFKRVDDRTLTMNLTIDDPIAYTRIWDATPRNFRLRANDRAGEAVCEDMFLNDAFGLHPKLPSRD
jgi:hypothetical protein